jgi:hypothetical protein
MRFENIENLNPRKREINPSFQDVEVSLEAA